VPLQRPTERATAAISTSATLAPLARGSACTIASVSSAPNMTSSCSVVVWSLGPRSWSVGTVAAMRRRVSVQIGSSPRTSSLAASSWLRAAKSAIEIVLGGSWGVSPAASWL
jgi:hypothetical protein